MRSIRFLGMALCVSFLLHAFRPDIQKGDALTVVFAVTILLQLIVAQIRSTKEEP